MKPLCIYHGNCADGFTAAWAVYKALGDTVEFYPGVYGVDPPDPAGRDIVMVDFSYKRPVLAAMGKVANTILVLDHHKTAAEDLSVFRVCPGKQYDIAGMAQSAMEAQDLPIEVVFDMDRSGAQITWDFFNRLTSRPPLVDYVGDRDLWRFALPRSREVSAFVFAHEYTFQNWDTLDVLTRGSLMAVADMGAAIEKKHHKDVAELVNVTRRTMRIGGMDMPVANIPYTLTSDAGNLMAKHDQGVAACYWDTPNGRVFSLRSTEAGPDVSAIAKVYGGGGHKNAAGFQMPIGWEGDTTSL